MTRMQKAVLGLATLLFLCMVPALMSAQAGGKNPTSVTGCVKQGGENGGYYLMGDDSRMYELISAKVNVGEHLNHEVTVMGHVGPLTKAEEAKRESAEKTEAGSNKYVDFHVTSLKMVSESCGQ